jgi:uroporphyrinogen-III decarboxylase
LFVGGNRDELVAETERILHSGVLEGGRFILQEGNNLPPRTPLDYCQAVYETAERAGRRDGWW